MAPNRSANGNCSRWTGWIEPPAADEKPTSGRFDRAASSAVMITGTAATRTPVPPRNRYPKVTASTARKLIAELKTASKTWSGENSSDCGSEISGQPAKTLGAHHGHSPRANDVAKNCTCGKNCDLASHGIVTAPDSQGQAGSRKASAKTAIVATSGTRALAMPAAARSGLPTADHADGDISPSARVSDSR